MIDGVYVQSGLKRNKVRRHSSGLTLNGQANEIWIGVVAVAEQLDEIKCRIVRRLTISAQRVHCDSNLVDVCQGSTQDALRLSVQD